ncbi:MAG TPA: type II toxin-antitoxin system VapC family toxin [Bradyrhizobium sp.]
MAYLADTNIIIYARDGHETVLEKFFEYSGQVFVSAISLAELQRGLNLAQTEVALRRERHNVLLQSISVLAFDTNAALAYGRVTAQCGRVKSRDIDNMIAAHALSTGTTLVTNNIADFAGIAGLSLENWADA